MKKTLILLIITAFSLFAEEGLKPLEISHLTANFYIFTTYKNLNGKPFPSNGMYAVTDSGVVLIDTPWNPEQTLPLLDSIKAWHQKKVVMCISTHYHDDRTAGLDILRKNGVKTFSSLQTLELCKKFKEKEAQFTFVNDTAFSLDGLNFETFYPGEGHTKDNIVVWFPKEKVLYGGCFIKSMDAEGLGNTADANVPEWSVSLKKLIKKYPKPEYVISGHQGWESKAAIMHTFMLLKKK
jgi:metallo-beta-lactamase class B